MTSSKTFFYLCLAFVGGIFLNSVFSVSQVLMLGFLIVGVLFISVLWKHKRIVIFGSCIVFVVLGVFWHQNRANQILESQLQDYNDTKEVNLIGLVVKEPDVRENHTKLTVQFKGISGKALVSVNKYSGYLYGDKIKVSGFLQEPFVFEDFNYKDYLAKEGIYSVIYYPETELLQRGQGNFVLSSVFALKDKLRGVIYQNLSPPQSSILAAILLGDKRQISDEWKDKLNMAGVRHLTAISGMHVAILTSILMSLLLGLGLWRKQAFFVTLGIISLFIIMTGLQPSAVRAGIMGGFFLLAQYLGRQNVSLRALVLAAVLMLVHNPLLLTLDVGFQLSFLAIIGIIYFLPFFRGLFKKVPNFFQLREVMSMTLAAQVFTLPILIYNFGYFSLVSPFTNILIVPLLPYILGLGFLFLLFGLLSPLAFLLSLPVLLLLNYLTIVVDFFSGFAFSAVFMEMPFGFLVFIYLILSSFIFLLHRQERLKFLKY